MKFKASTILFIMAAATISCGKKNGADIKPSAPTTPLTEATKVNITVDESVKYQTIDGFGFFGAADNWWADAGAVWTDAWGEKVISDLGITIWRNEIVPPATPAVGQAADWNKQKPVVEGLKLKADKYHVDLKFIATVWSPPADLKWLASFSWPGDTAAMRGPGSVTTENGGTLNPNKYGEYATWLKTNIQLYKNSGVNLYALSLQNEPMFDEPYNSCTYTTLWYNQLLVNTVPIVKSAFPDLKIYGSENMLEFEGKDGNWPYFYHAAIEASPSAKANIDLLAVHGYTNGVVASSGSELAKMWTNHLTQFAIPMNKKTWMTETSGYADTWETSNNIPGAINLAMDMYSALYYGNISAWVWWQGSESVASQYNLMGGLTGGKKYAVSKQFYRYIRPGAVRVKSNSDNGDVYVTAYEHVGKGTFTFVIINSGDAKRINIQSAGIPTSYKMYRTSASVMENCSLIGDVTLTNTSYIDLPAKSVITLQAGGDAL